MRDPEDFGEIADADLADLVEDWIAQAKKTDPKITY